MEKNKIRRRAHQAVLCMSVTSIVMSAVLSFMYLSSTVGWLAYIVPEGLKAPRIFAIDTRTVSSPFLYTFRSNGLLVESGSMSESSSPYFWLNSGGLLSISNGVGKTVQGALPKGSYWQNLYGETNSLDTAGGYYPQNLLRLLTRATWKDVSEEVSFKINKLNTTNTPNRGEWSGILLMSRYQNSDNLYYAGIRQDGTTVIKKKYQGTYYTLAQAPISGFSGAYNRDTNPNLIPTNTWMRLKTETVTDPGGTVRITVYLDQKNTGNYVKILSATDTPKNGGGVIDTAGSAGIRGDYFDLEFDNYLVKKI